MNFRTAYPDYKTYDESEFYLRKVPAGLCSALMGLILRYANDSSKLKVVCHDIATRVPCEPTTNWGWDWLVSDFDHLLHRLCQGKFHKFMDFISWFAHENMDDEGFEDLNDILAEYEFGYRLENQLTDAVWDLVTEVSHRTSSVQETKEELRDVCKIAIEHLQQAFEHLKKPHDARARKDAVRDCMSAMESMLKSLSGTSDIKEATKSLRKSKQWGEDTIVKDGLSIWNRLHDLYPDIRHGASSSSSLDDDEAIYWIDRINTFVRYISRRKKTGS